MIIQIKKRQRLKKLAPVSRKIRGVYKKYWEWSYVYQDRNEQWIEREFFFKYIVGSKSIATGALFTKTEKNNDGNVNFFPNTKTERNNKGNHDFLQNTSCVQKVSTLKLHLTKEKPTIN